MTSALERLQSGYYNSDPVSPANPGGLADGGHVANFPAALDDIASAVAAILVDAEAIAGAGPAAAAAVAASAEAQAAREAATEAAGHAADDRAAAAAAQEAADQAAGVAVEKATEAAASAQAAADIADGVAGALGAAQAARDAAQAAVAPAEAARDAAQAAVEPSEAAFAGAQAAQAAAEAARDAALTVDPSAFARKSENLADLPDPAAARDALSVHSMAQADERFRKVDDSLAVEDVDGLTDALGGRASQGALDDLAGRVQVLEDNPGGAVESVAGLTGPINGADLNTAMGNTLALSEMAFRLARLEGDNTRYAQGVSDDFADQDGVDLGASVNEDYVTSGTKGYRGRHWVDGAVTAVPNNLVSNAGGAAAGDDATAAWQAFDGSSATYWSPPTDSWLRRDFGTAKRIISYGIRGGNNPMWMARGWVIEVSNDASAWVQIDSRSGQSFAANETKSFTCATPQAATYRYVRFRVTLGATPPSSGSYIGELTFNEQPTVFETAALTLRTIGFTASAAPSRAGLLIRASTASGSITANTNLVARISRDGGATFTAVTLTAVLTIGAVTLYFGTVDLSAQPSGTTLKASIETTTGGGADITIDGYDMRWA